MRKRNLLRPCMRILSNLRHHTHLPPARFVSWGRELQPLRRRADQNLVSRKKPTISIVTIVPGSHMNVLHCQKTR